MVVLKPIKESDLVNAYLWKFFRDAPQWRRVRLGIVPNHQMARMYAVVLRWADAIAISEGIVYIIEAKLRPSASAIGQLEHYQKLFRLTPEFSTWKTWPIKLIFITTFLDLELAEFAQSKDIDYIVFTEDDALKAYDNSS